MAGLWASEQYNKVPYDSYYHGDMYSEFRVYYIMLFCQFKVRFKTQNWMHLLHTAFLIPNDLDAKFI
jgi:hypothetical protein